MRLNEIVGSNLDPELYEEIPSETISKIAQNVFSNMYPDVELITNDTPEGYAELYTETGDNDLYILIGCSIQEGTISINLSGGSGSANSGKFKGAITEIIKTLYRSVVQQYGTPTEAELTIDHDTSHGVWQHIANKIGLKYSTHRSN